MVDIAISAPARSIDAQATSISRLRMTSRIEIWCTSTSYIDFSSDVGVDALRHRQVALRVHVDAQHAVARSANAAARFSVVVVLATPPFWLANAMTLAFVSTVRSDASGCESRLRGALFARAIGDSSITLAATWLHPP